MLEGEDVAPELAGEIEGQDVEPEPEPEIDLCGYSSVEDLARAYRASSAEGKRLFGELQRVRTEVNPRQPVPQREHNGNGNGAQRADEPPPSPPLRSLLSLGHEGWDRGPARRLEHFLGRSPELVAEFEQRYVSEGTHEALWWAASLAQRSERLQTSARILQRRGAVDAGIPSGAGGWGRIVPEEPSATDKARDAVARNASRQNREAFALARIREAMPDLLQHVQGKYLHVGPD